MTIRLSTLVCLGCLILPLISPVYGEEAKDLSKDPFRLVVCPASPENPRNSEADIVELKDGTLLLAWSRFRRRDDATAVTAKLTAVALSEESYSADNSPQTS